MSRTNFDNEKQTFFKSIKSFCIQLAFSKIIYLIIHQQFEQVYLLNLNCSHSENFREFIQKIQENQKRFQIDRRKSQGLKSIIHRTSQDFLNIFQLINSNIRTKVKQDNPQTNQQASYSRDNQGLINFQSISFPELEPITFEQFLYMKSRISQNKALTNILISDTWISKNGSFIILNGVQRSSTQDLVKNFGEFFIIPINKNYTNIPQASEFRPITILSPLYKWLELRFFFLKNLQADTVKAKQQNNMLALQKDSELNFRF
ncbi:unnamed protein product [Paramecium pentaurelia]|uniref:Uncharacterized protein n=1 Tax=Paramecium pentaurelia TaxID=43138 RepID=A0A8S1USM4_9CILI|nr:unnamed protein product [Paramecium pentaurelia]